MKKIIVCFLTTVILLTNLAAYAEGGNYSDEMKIAYKTDISPEDGADSVERLGDHQDSPYFSRLDFYNMESTDTLTILPKFKTIQQTSEWSCGVTAALMVIDYYGKLSDHDEASLAKLRTQGDAPGATSLSQAIAIFDAVGGFELQTTLDYGEAIHDEFSLETIQAFLKDGIPVMIGWNDWGGHWQVIIGYDTMGTETEQDDVLIVADPYDTTDHNQDGYGVYGAERFIYNFTMYDFFDDSEGNDMLFIAAKPAA
jgi:ABC-type bacteriocin/lantibiotic exporters, contain an N-terminal double-glycine peptidase domain